MKKTQIDPKKIKRRMKALKMTQSELAVKMGVSRQTICQYFTQAAMPKTFAKLDRLARALKVKPLSLFK